MEKKKIINIAVVVVAVGFLGSLLLFGSSNPGSNFAPWNEAMTLGEKNSAQRHYVMYTDLTCPYCDMFSNALAAHDEEFKKEYLEGHKIFYEVRVTDMNFHAHNQYENSRLSAESAYCSAAQNKFWEYYHAILAQLYTDYHSKGIGASRDAKEHIPPLEIAYFLTAGEGIEGLDLEKFKGCLENHETRAEVEKNTKRASQFVQGLPTFQFRNFNTPGFAGNWDTEHDWQEAKTMLEAGL